MSGILEFSRERSGQAAPRFVPFETWAFRLRSHETFVTRISAPGMSWFSTEEGVSAVMDEQVHCAKYEWHAQQSVVGDPTLRKPRSVGRPFVG